MYAMYDHVKTCRLQISGRRCGMREKIADDSFRLYAVDRQDKDAIEKSPVLQTSCIFVPVSRNLRSLLHNYIWKQVC
jgi:hypothetical protein